MTASANRQTYPVLRVILAASAAMEDVDRALARMQIQIEEAEIGTARLGRAVMSGSRLMEMSRIYMADRDALSRCLSRACGCDDAAPFEIPRDCRDLLSNYLRDQLPGNVIDLLSSTRPELVDALQPDLVADTD